jgi:hypothetical protein
MAPNKHALTPHRGAPPPLIFHTPSFFILPRRSYLSPNPMPPWLPPLHLLSTTPLQHINSLLLQAVSVVMQGRQLCDCCQRGSWRHGVPFRDVERGDERLRWTPEMGAARSLGGVRKMMTPEEDVWEAAARREGGGGAARERREGGGGTGGRSIPSKSTACCRPCCPVAATEQS